MGVPGHLTGIEGTQRQDETTCSVLAHTTVLGVWKGGDQNMNCGPWTAHSVVECVCVLCACVGREGTRVSGRPPPSPRCTAANPVYLHSHHQVAGLEQTVLSALLVAQVWAELSKGT